MPGPQKTAPIDHPYYKAVRKAAESAELLQPFRNVCALLGAPADFGNARVFANLRLMLENIPETWKTEDTFNGWKEVIEWWANLHSHRAFPSEFPRSRDPRGEVREIKWTNLRPFSIFWAAACSVDDDRYLLLLAQLLIARSQHLKESQQDNKRLLPEGTSFEDLYESHSGTKDFASPHVTRSPLAAAAALSAIGHRLEAKRRHALLSELEPTLTPTAFRVHIPELLPASLADLEPLTERIKSFCEPKSVAPREHPVYQAVLSRITEQGLAEPFRRICMLLNAPHNLRPLKLVLANIREMLQALPNTWHCEHIFAGWNDVADWVLSEENFQELERLARARLDIPPRKRVKNDATQYVHPMEGEGIARYPLFAMMCDKHCEEGATEYLQLQAHLLIARWEELQSAADRNPIAYEELYESYAGEDDFPQGVRTPYPASFAVRQMSDSNWTRVLEYIECEDSPDEFASEIDRKDLPLGANGEDFWEHVNHIRNYCLRETHARDDVAHGPHRSPDQRLQSTFIPYNETRFGAQEYRWDQDDPGFQDPNHEWIRERDEDTEYANLEDAHPNENTRGGAYLLGRHGAESELGNRAAARTNIHHIEIDKTRMPWSLIHLRVKEIANLFRKELENQSLKPTPSTSEERNQLEDAALVAVCLETGRSIEEAVALAANATADDSFSFIQDEFGSSWWRIGAIQPRYETERPLVHEKEISRVSHLLYPVHDIPRRLLQGLIAITPKESSRVFPQPVERYKRRIKDWLSRLDTSKRLTMTKIANLKWCILVQNLGCDFATASLVMGAHHTLGEVALYYSLIAEQTANDLFKQATAILWDVSVRENQSSPEGENE